VSIRVFLAEDSEIMRETIVRFCARHPEVLIVGQSADFREALDLTAALKPDVLLMDLRMAERVHGQTKKLKKDASSLRIVVMSASDDDEVAQEITRRIDADMFVDKMCLYEKLIPAILQTESLPKGAGRECHNANSQQPPSFPTAGARYPPAAPEHTQLRKVIMSSNRND
jgi:DNA-binding NarL/FixJ family response regulator